MEEVEEVEEGNSGARFSPRKTKDRTYCSVYGCSSRAASDHTLRFHKFPKFDKDFVIRQNTFGESEKIERVKMWLINLKMSKKTLTPNTRVCSLHFKKEDYILPNISSAKRYLKTSAVPSCNLPTRQKSKDTESTAKLQKQNNRKREERTINRNKKKQDVGQIDIQEHNEDWNEELMSNDNDPPTTEASTTSSKTFQSIGIQVNTGDIAFKFSNLLTTDKELSTVTGIPSFEILQRIVKATKIAYPEKRRTNLDTHEKIIMTFMKLKHNMSYTLLASLFKCVKMTQCRKIVYNMLSKLGNVLKRAIPFPSMEQISRNIPDCFDDFRDVRVIIDCTEITIQRPKNLCCQIAVYSRYKHNYTIKFMTGVTPGGLISFVSKAYGGRASDNAIFEQSKILDRMSKNEAIMVDKGFTVDNICLRHGIKLVRPPFLRDKVQFSKEEALTNAKIAKARVHIERSNQRLKVFKVLSAGMPIGLLKKSEDIFIIIAAIVNMSKPILSDDKF